MHGEGRAPEVPPVDISFSRRPHGLGLWRKLIRVVDPQSGARHAGGVL